MESFIALVVGVIGLFALLMIWIVVRIIHLGEAQGRVAQFDQELDRLRARVTTLEVSSAAQAAPMQVAEFAQQQPKPQPVTQPRVLVTSPPQPQEPAFAPVQAFAEPVVRTFVPPVQPMRAAPVAPPSMSLSQPPPVARPRISLEERLGQNWLNKLGIVILVTGLVLLLGYQARTLGPMGKSILGLVLSSGILGTGLVLERRERYRLFARAAIGGGWALLYFVSLALFHLPAMQVLHSQATDLVLMLTVAVAMVMHSLRYRSQVVTSLAFMLGFFTVSISHVTVFSLVASAILAAGLIAVAFRERWFLLVLGGLIAVYANHFMWLHRVLPTGATSHHLFPQFLPSAALLVLYWLLFRSFYIFCVPDNGRDRICSTLTLVLNSAGLLTLLKYQSSHPEWAFWGLLTLGAAEMALAFLARRRHHQAFVALACIASLFLLAAVPLRFAGSSWSLAWLLEAETLFLAGLALRETVFRRLGMLAALAAVLQLFQKGALPALDLRQIAPDPSHHALLSLTFGCTALLFWFNAEFAARRWPRLGEAAIDRVALQGLSCIAMLCAGLATWLALAGSWTLLPWLTIALVLAFAASKLQSKDLAQQADLLSLATIARTGIINFGHWNQSAGSPRVIIVLAAVALLYAHMRRRQPAYLLKQALIQPVFSWSAIAVLGTLAWYALQPAAVSVAWCLLGATLVELGLGMRRRFLLDQAFVLLAASFVRLFFINIALSPSPRLYTMLPLIAVYAWVYQRMYADEKPGPWDRVAASCNAWFALAAGTTLLYFSMRPAWVAIAGAVLSIALLLLARGLGRPLFTMQAVVMIVLTGSRTVAFNVIATQPLAASMVGGRLFTVGLTCALLLAALPLAYALRRQQADTVRPRGLHWLLNRPEQFLFFVPLAVLFAWVPVQLRAGMITEGWSALGLVAFLFALRVGERSFRLAGLGILLLGVAKILTVDVWHASPTDRYITLIVMGAALLLVSFLYSRYREKILELL